MSLSPTTRDVSVGLSNSNPTGSTFVAPSMRDLKELAEILERWLASKVAGATGIRVANLRYPQGSGQSHETILFEAAWVEQGRELERGLVVRVKPTSFLVFIEDLFYEEYLTMKTLEAEGVPVAEVFWYEEDPSVLGAEFFVMAQLHGKVPVSVPSYMEEGWVVDATPQQRRTLWEDAVRAFAALQSIPVERFSYLLNRPEIGDGFDQEWDRWERSFERIRSVRPLPFHEAVRQRLIETRPSKPPAGLMWGDARLGNLMFDEQFRLVAMMDWEQPSLGGGIQDLGWWLFNERAKLRETDGVAPDGLGTRDETISLWHEITGLPLDDLEWYEAYAGFKMMCLLTHMMDMRGQTPPNGDYALQFNSVLMAEMLGLRDGDW